MPKLYLAENTETGRAFYILADNKKVKGHTPCMVAYEKTWPTGIPANKICSNKVWQEGAQRENLRTLQAEVQWRLQLNWKKN